MEDLIKRSDAIEQLNEAISICPPCMKGTGIYRTSALEEAIDIINQIPSADRPQAEWVIEVDVNGNTYGRCPICGMRQYAGQINFCPECGSDMRKGARDEA